MKTHPKELNGLESLTAHSPAMQSLIETASVLAQSTDPLFIHGERGSGKRTLARAIHAEGPRAEHPLVTIRCGMLSVDVMERVLFGDPVEQTLGKLEEVGEGTLLLSRLEDLNPLAQECLLEVIERGRYVNAFGEERTLSCRIIATGDRAEIQRHIKTGLFSGTLYNRLAVTELRMPSLSERLDDVPHLVNDILQEFACRERIDAPAVPYHYLELLMSVSWPENVRQLRNHLESVMVLSEGRFDPAIIMQHFVVEAQPTTIKGTIQAIWRRLRSAPVNPVLNRR